MARIIQVLGARNGLFYATIFVSVGWAISQKKRLTSRKFAAIGFIVSMFCLAVESMLFVVFYHTEATILWLSVIPAVYFLVVLLLQINIDIGKGTSFMLRKMSTLMYVSQFLFIIALQKYCTDMALFLLVSLMAMIFSWTVIKLSGRYGVLKYLS